jgi:hypothetical protein
MLIEVGFRSLAATRVAVGTEGGGKGRRWRRGCPPAAPTVKRDFAATMRACEGTPTCRPIHTCLAPRPGRIAWPSAPPLVTAVPGPDVPAGGKRAVLDAATIMPSTDIDASAAPSRADREARPAGACEGRRRSPRFRAGIPAPDRDRPDPPIRLTRQRKLPIANSPVCTHWLMGALPPRTPDDHG